MFTPTMINGGQLIEQSPLPATAFTGTINAITQRTPTTNTILQMTFTTTTGAITQGMLLVNSTHSSRSLVYKNISSGLWAISQPVTDWVPGSPPPPAVFGAPADTWVSGDVIYGYVPTSVREALIGGQNVDLITLAMGHQLYQLTLVGAFAGPTIPTTEIDVDAASSPILSDCVVTAGSLHVFGNVAIIPPIFVNTGMGGFQNSGVFETEIYGGYSAACSICGNTLNNVYMTDFIIAAPTFFNHGPHAITQTMNRFIYVESGTTLTLLGDHFLNTGGAIYGPGTVNERIGVLRYGGPGANAFPISGLQIGNATTAYSNASSGGITTVHQVSLTANALDTAAGATGFGGLAYIPGVAAITNGSTP